MSPVFLLLALLAAGPSSGQECRLTTRDQEGPFFVPGAPEGPVIAPEDEMTPERAAVLTGTVMDRDCNPLPGARVEVWYAGGGPNGADYTFQGDDYLWYRGNRDADENGVYEFRGTFPGTYRGRSIPHVHFKVTARQTEFVTQLYFRDSVPRRYEQYVVGRDSQFPQNDPDQDVLVDSAGRRIQFDIVLDV